MSTITLSGLSTGLDTESIISALLGVEQESVTTLEEKKTTLNDRLEAFKTFDSKLSALQSAVEDLDTAKEFGSYAADVADESYFSATASGDAVAGTYQIEVVSLASAQKDASTESFTDTTSQNLSGTLTIGATDISYENVSLGELAEMINDADTGVSASILQVGTDGDYRLVLTGDSAGVDTAITGTGSIAMDTATDGHTRDATSAHLVVDGVDVYRNANVLSDVVPGVTLDLNKVNATGETTSLTIAPDTEAIAEKIDGFVSAYNAIVEFIADQSEESWGSDSAFSSVKRGMQALLRQEVGGTSLLKLGLKTDAHDGTISIDSATLADALESDLESVTALFAGNDSEEGLASRFDTFLAAKTNATTGLLASRQKTTDASIKRIDNDIARTEARLEAREEFLREQYAALETLVDSLNSQASYLDSIGGGSDS